MDLVLEFHSLKVVLAVSFDPITGSRSVATQVPGYDLVALTSEYWEVSDN
jgi:hypothetical protein